MPGGFSNDFVKLVVDYHQKKMQSSKNFKYPAKMGDVNKEKFKNFMRFHKIIVNHKGQPLIQQKSYYEQKRASSALIPISRAKFRKLYLNHAQNIYQRPHFVRILTRKDEKQVFQKYHIVDGKHQGMLSRIMYVLSKDYSYYASVYK